MREGQIVRRYHYNKLRQSPRFKYQTWKITEEEFKIENNHQNESIFSLGNGYMGIRGTLEEDYTGLDDTTTPGSYINGIYGSEDIIYSEYVPRQPEKSQSILNIADWSEINLYLGEEKFNMFEGETINYQRVLDMKKGILYRELLWKSPDGKEIQIKVTRLLSFLYQHTAAIIYEIKPLNFTEKIKFVSAINGGIKNNLNFRNKKALELKNIGISNKRGFLVQKAESTGIEIGLAMYNEIKNSTNIAVDERTFTKNEKLSKELIFRPEKNKSYTLKKFVSIYTSRDVQSERLIDKTLETLDISIEMGVKDLFSSQRKYLDDYWQDVDVVVEGDDSIQQALRFNAFHLLQSTGRDGYTNVAAKGLTGEFYEGHYFWDTETFIIPFYLYNRPSIAKSLLFYRYNILNKARENASRIKLKGALYPWRTIDGDEASGFFMGSTVQYHINADIAYAIYQYLTVTEDYEFLYQVAAEILMETARMWVSRGNYTKLKGGKFCINEVCGPDEYKPGVDNNCYTNYMAKFNLEYALDVVELMKEKAAEKFAGIKKKIDLKDSELEEWREAADKMYLPYNETLAVHPQDDSFLYKEEIDIDSIPGEEIPLVHNWHPLTIWRYQVIKQADVILLMLLHGDKFTMEEKKANYDYYEPRTTHDSSLSPSIYSIIASEIAYYEEAYNYFTQIARLDLDDYNKDTYKGVHTAGMGSAWMTLVYGFAGMRNYNEILHFNPYLPEKLNGYKFTIKYKGRELKITVNNEGVFYRLIKGDSLKIKHLGEDLYLSPEEIRANSRDKKLYLEKVN